MDKQFVRFSFCIITILFLSGSSKTRAADIVWTNLAGGNWTTAAGWSPNQVPGANDTAFITNAGTYTVTLNTAASISNLIVGLDASGGQPTLSVSSTLALGGGWDIGTNGVVDFIGTLNGAGSITNRGLFNFYSSVIQGAGLFINQTQGRIVEPYAFGQRYLYRALINYGVYDRSGSAAVFVTMSTAGSITNEAGGVINLGVYGFDGSAPASVVNRGTINMLSVNSVQPSWITAPFLNYGALNVGVSNSLTTFYANIYGGTNTGTIHLSPNGWLFNQTGTFALESGTQLLGTGSLISQNTGDILFNTPLTSSNQIYCGWSLGSPAIRLNANLTSLNSFTVGTGGRLYLTNPAVTLDCKNLFVGTAAAFVTNGATLQADLFQVDNGTVHNGSLINVRSNFNFNGGSFYGYGTATLNTPSNCVSVIGSGVGKTFNTTRWNNYGTVNFNATSPLNFVNSHWINYSNGIVNAAGTGLAAHSSGTNSFVNYGLVSRSGINSNPSFNVPTTNYGNFNLSGTTITLGQFTQIGGRTDLGGSQVNGAKFDILGGELYGAATVQTSPSLYNAAALRPGSPLGLLSVAGPFTNAASGTYDMQIAATNNYDRINVNGAVTLAGILNVTFTNGFFPVIGSTFTALTWTARSGVFDQILTPNYEFEIIYTATNLLLRASNALPVVSFTISGGNTQLVCNPFQLTATATDPDGAVTNLAFFVNGSLLTSNAGNSLITLYETDFPGTNLFEARALDDRGGTGVSNRSVAVVTLPLHILTLGGVRSNGFKICMVGEVGSNYVVYATTNLNQPFASWTNLGLMENTNGIWRYYDGGTITNRDQRYYRSQQQ